MTILNAAQIAILRSQPHFTQWGLSIFIPQTLVARKVTGGTFGARTISFATDTSVNDAGQDAQYKNYVGLTCYAKTATDVKLGKVRVRSINFTTKALVVAENNIDWSLASYFQIINMAEPWAVWPRINLETVAGQAKPVPIFYKDYDIAYSNQNDNPDPIPMMGPNRAGYISSTSGVGISFFFDGGDSYTLDSTTITTFDWDFPGALTTTATGVTPGDITWTEPGHYLVSLTVSNGTKSTTGFRHVSVYDPDAQTQAEGKPITNWGLSGLSGDYQQGGWTGSIWMRESAGSGVVDDAIVTIFEVATYYGDTSTGIGGNYEFCEDIIFTGYIADGSISVDPTTNVVSFNITNLAGRLQNMECPSVSISSRPASTDVPAWQASHVYDIGENKELELFVRANPTNNRVYKCIASGTSSAVQPTWPTNGTSIVDGTTKWVDTTTWYYIKYLTTDKAIYHYLRWHSTVYNIADVNKNGVKVYATGKKVSTGEQPHIFVNNIPEPIYTAGGDDNEWTQVNKLGQLLGIKGQDFGKQSLYAALDSFLQSAILSHITVDRQGQVWMETKLDYLPTTNRPINIIMGVARADWRDSISITQTRVPSVSYVEAGGLYYNNISGIFTPVISSAPSNLQEYFGHPITINGLVCQTQAINNQLVGDVYADKTKRYPSITLPMAGYYPVADIAPQEILGITLSTSENYLELNWVNKQFVPRTFQWQYDASSRTCLVDIMAEELTSGSPGQAGPYPPEDSDDGGYDVPVPPGVPPIPGAVSPVIVATQTDICYTGNYNESSAWRLISQGITGTIVDLELDKFDHTNKAWVATTDGIFMINNYTQYVPDTAHVLSNTIFKAGTGTTKVISSCRVGVTIAVNGVVYASIVCTDGSVYTAYSDDFGDTWTFSSLITTTELGAEQGFAVSQHDYQKLLVTGSLGELWYSDDSGANWANIYTVPDASLPIANIAWPYADNATDQIIYIGGR